jgi:SulP family sulfate permease
VAVIGAIIASWALDLQAHDVLILGPVPSGLPGIGLPTGLTWHDTTSLLPTAISMFLVILAQSAATSRAHAVKYNERLTENTDPVGLGPADVSAGVSGTFVVNGSPTRTEMVDEAKSHTQVAQLTTAVVVTLVTAVVVVVIGVEQGDGSGWPSPRPAWSPSPAWSSTGSRSGSSTPTRCASPRKS